MKTPREILLERHQAVMPKLNVIRQEIVMELNHEGAKARSWDLNFVSWCLCGSRKLWLELILPSRRIWAGLTAVWIVIALANASLRDRPQPSMAKASPTPEMILAFRQEKNLLNELIGQSESQPAEPPKVFAPRPSSRRQFEVLTV